MILTSGKTSIGAYNFPDRKKPCLCIGAGNQLVVYGTFRDEKAANEFMKQLAAFCGAKMDGGDT